MTRAVEPPRRRRLNQDEKRELRAADAQLFAKKYGRKSQKGVEPNDRKYDREFGERLKQIEPDELDRLLRHGEE